ncbi:TonB-dependent hemoglobin/transferrin/lactoferrin family receptor [Bordetella bronchiseptica]|uniref:TonB-dependent hemoglobin/transferrin/lactoferrin family receptor n=1 Tax=Bordetella bronchiseptica TaxID=518 RepID=UPI00143E2B84|nr:TonB-dependent hemoglobin/transferrin/lactoferrin family receptor [Bordetella bronchiseptica]QIX98547.1 TonB-dependent hemoglobin/transferrin/lactoferrin family receptor [Bordetella bronchiseptica]QIY03007.1 TonB-dependent hemoglobin/transferrin/lactoferrin family receptor [Bordetella bronchiseptica]
MKYVSLAGLAAALLALPAPATAQARPAPYELDSILVEGEAPAQASTFTETADDFARNNVHDARDLLREHTGVSVVEAGRAGGNGFAIRGVEGNRVAITVDGVAQADNILPAVYAGYGYFNGNRNDVELEHMREVTVHKGAHSFEAGSGAIGGAVQYRTKDLDDFVAAGRDVGAFLKSGYASRNREWLAVAGAGVRLGKGGFLLQHTRRRGHETRAYGDGADVTGPARGLADPARRRAQGWLAKLRLCNDGPHCASLGYEGRDLHTRTDEYSYSPVFGQQRRARDSSPYRRFSAGYAWTPADHRWLRSLGLDYHRQDIDLHAVTENLSLRDPGFVDQRYDRSLSQRTDRYVLNWEARPFDAGAVHRLHGDASWTRTDWNNHNVDELFFRDSPGGVSRYRISNPVRTRAFSIGVADDMQWGADWQVRAGLRHDRYRHQIEHAADNQNPASYDMGGARYGATTWFATVSHALSGQLQLSYAAASGFRAPNARELYFEFRRGDNYLDANPGLRPETALNQEVTLSWESPRAQAAVALFQSDYRHFIEERHTEVEAPNPYYEQTPEDIRKLYPDLIKPTTVQSHFRHENVDRARVRGLDFQARVNLHGWLGVPRGWSADVRLTHARGRTSLGDGMRALQPFKAVLGLAYQHPGNQWGVRATATYLGAKRARDTLRTTYGWRGAVRRPARHLNAAAWVANLHGHVRLTRRFTLNLAVNNVFNRRYSTWDSLRSIPESGTTNMVDRQGRGLARFTAPGRNYALNLVGRF